MYTKAKYPKLNILSKNELAKHIHSKDFSIDEAKTLINQVLLDPESHWKDSKRYSKPETGKYERNAKRTPLGDLLKKIDSKVLAPCDNLLPAFIFGGIKNSSHIKASKHLLGNKRKRSLLGLDIKSFFETIKEDRVSYFFKKCGCSLKASKLIAKLCCVPLGEKGNGSKVRTIARGFATSPRLAVWCNLETFMEVERISKAVLKNSDPRIAIYVDDVGITASRVTDSDLEEVKIKAIEILSNFDKNQKLPVNDKKTKKQNYLTGIEHLGLRYERNKLLVGKKTTSKLDKVSREYEHGNENTKKLLKNKKKAYFRYKDSVTKA